MSPLIRTAFCSFSILIFSLLLSKTDGLAVMSIDFGTEWMKIGIVYPGVPMEIVLNRESKRKTPVAISFRNDEREIGEEAMSLGVRFPELTYTHLLDLIGKKLDNPVVRHYQERFPHHRLSEDPETETVIFQKSDNTTFSVEELISMILSRAKELAEEYADQTIKDVVITVPAFFNQAERRALLLAADLANMKVLQLINDNAAVALNYGVFRRKDFNTTTQYIMFYDMGAQSTKATIVGYQLVKTKERGFVESNPQLTILGFGYDRTLGGSEFTLRLRNYLAKVFNEQKKTTKDVFQFPRALAKLRKEADRVKMVLSANPDHIAQVENLLDEIDFKAPIQRPEFEDLCQDLFDRVSRPVTSALEQASMTMDEIDQVILVGAGTRIPKIQEKLLEVVKKPDLGKNVNTDEAAALGAVYQAAFLSQGFKVKKFVVKDAVLYPIQVDFEREIEGEDGSSKGVKIVSRTLFGLLNPYPLKKVMTFNRLNKNDFEFYVNYGDLKMVGEDKKIFGSLNITRVELTGIKDATDKHLTDGSEAKGVKAHFRMDESGILTLDHVESVFEIKEEVTEPEIDLESAFSKLGSTISKLFSGGDSMGEEKPAKTDETSADEDAPRGEKPLSGDQNAEHAKDESVTNETSGTTNNKTAEDEGTQTRNRSETNGKNGTSANTTEGTNATLKQEKKPKIVLVKEPISMMQAQLDLKEPSPEQLQKITRRIELLTKLERQKKEKEESKNNLEAFILDTQDKLYQQEFEAASTEKEREKIQSQMSEISDWLYEEGEESDSETYRNKLMDLQILTKDLFIRVKEHKDRPEALNTLRDLINMSEVFLQKARALSEDEQYFTTVEMDTLEKVIADAKKWKVEKEEEQAKHPLTEMPKVTVRQVAEKIALLDREVKYLLNKARTTKPKEKKAKADATNKTTNATEDLKDSTHTDGETQLPLEEDSNSQTTKDDASDVKLESADETSENESKPSSDPSQTEEKMHSEL